MAKPLSVAKLSESIASPFYLGLGLIWSWPISFWMTLYSSPLYQQAPETAYSLWVSWQLAAVLAFVFLSLASTRWPLVVHNWEIVAAVCCSFIGCCILVLPTLATEPFLLTELGSILMGIGCAWLYLLWGQSLERVGVGLLEATIPSCGLASFVCILLSFLLGGAVKMLVVISLPLLSGLLLAKAGLSPETDGERKASWAKDRDFFLSLVVLVCASALASFVGDNPLFSQLDGAASVDNVSTLIGSIFSVGVCIAAVMVSLRMDMTVLAPDINSH